MPDWQKSVRTERRDRYFYFTAIFGSESGRCCLLAPRMESRVR